MIPSPAPLLGCGISSTNIFVAYEFDGRGSLHSMIKESQSILPIRTSVRIALELAQAFNFLHTQKQQLHGMLDSNCVLIDHNMSVKLIDTGMRSIKSYVEAMVLLGHRIISEWSAPEIMQGEVATKNSDVYSFGVVCWELLTSSVPFQAEIEAAIDDDYMKNNHNNNISNNDHDRSHKYTTREKQKYLRKLVLERKCSLVIPSNLPSAPRGPETPSDTDELVPSYAGAQPYHSSGYSILSFFSPPTPSAFHSNYSSNTGNNNTNANNNVTTSSTSTTSTANSSSSSVSITIPLLHSNQNTSTRNSYSNYGPSSSSSSSTRTNTNPHFRFGKLIESCISFNQHERPSFSDIVFVLNKLNKDLM
jgi:hypothetical protein